MHITHYCTYVISLNTEVSPSFFSQLSATKQKHAKTNNKIERNIQHKNSKKNGSKGIQLNTQKLNTGQKMRLG